MIGGPDLNTEAVGDDVLGSQDLNKNTHEMDPSGEKTRTVVSCSTSVAAVEEDTQVMMDLDEATPIGFVDEEATQAAAAVGIDEEEATQITPAENVVEATEIKPPAENDKQTSKEIETVIAVEENTRVVVEENIQMVETHANVAGFQQPVVEEQIVVELKVEETNVSLGVNDDDNEVKVSGSDKEKGGEIDTGEEKDMNPDEGIENAHRGEEDDREINGGEEKDMNYNEETVNADRGEENGGEIEGGEKKDVNPNEETEDVDCGEPVLGENIYLKEVLPDYVINSDEGFAVGDFVWGKVRGHPWWPGIIFDAGDASEQANKYCRKDAYLVAYFGDHTFAWCEDSQLKPFWTEFERMHKQSSSTTFVSAVDCTLEEIARCMELGLTSGSPPEEVCERLASSPVLNAGIREGAAVPEDVGKEISVSAFKPDKFVECIKDLALFETGKMINVLELTLIKAQLSAFYTSKGYLRLPEYHLVFLPGSEGVSPSKGSISKDKEEEEEEEEEERKSHSKGKGVSKESPSHARKRKSMAEIMHKDRPGSRRDTTSVEKQDDSKDRTRSSDGKGKEVVGSGSAGQGRGRGRPRKVVQLEEDGSAGGEGKKDEGHDEEKLTSEVLTSPKTRGRPKKAKDSLSIDSTEKKRNRTRSSSSADEKTLLTRKRRPKKVKDSLSIDSTEKKSNQTVSASNADEETPAPRKGRPKKVKDSLSIDSTEKKSNQTLSTSNADEETPAPRKGRPKKVKYSLSIDTTEKRRNRARSLSNADEEAPASGKSFKLGERISKIAGKLTGPLTILKCTNEMPEEGASEPANESTIPETPRRRKPTEKALAYFQQMSSGERRKRTAKGSASSDDEKSRKNRSSLEGIRSDDSLDKRDDGFKKRISLPKVVCSSDEMLALLCTAAEDPLEGIEVLSDLIDFFIDFRNSLYEKGSSYDWYKKSLEKLGVKSGKRKSLDEKSDDAVGSPNSKPRSTKSLKSDEHSPILAKEPEMVVANTEPIDDLDDKDSDGLLSFYDKTSEDSSPTALILTFTEGETLPSESELIETFGRYGPLEESETEVLRRTCRAKVVFKRRPDAEVAFSSAGKFSIFGPSLVSYRLKYLSSTSKASPRTAMRDIMDAAAANGNTGSVLPAQDTVANEGTGKLE